MTASLPNFYLPRPPGWTTSQAAAFETVYAEQVRTGRGAAIHDELAAPKWQFLCWLADTKDVVLHGSGSPDITEFALHRPNDKAAFADRPGVFAASDGIWAMFFAIVDRTVAQSLVNASFVVVQDRTRSSYYYFSVNADALDRGPWRPGTVYVLPRTTFEQQPAEDLQGHRIEANQWVSTTPVRPLAKLAVTPSDFPFVDEVHGHDVATVMARAEEDPDGFPWRGD